MNRAAFDALYRDQRESILALAFQMTGSRSLAEDVLQETFLRAWKHRRSFRGESRVSTWLYRIAIRSAVRARTQAERHRRVPQKPLLQTKEPGEAVDRSQQRERLYAALDAIDQEHRVVLAMLTLRGLTSERIGEILGIPPNTVYSRAAAARRRLREALESDPGR